MCFDGDLSHEVRCEVCPPVASCQYSGSSDFGAVGVEVLAWEGRAWICWSCVECKVLQWFCVPLGIGEAGKLLLG